VKIWLNNRLIDARKAYVSVFDHGFLYGDGIYETVHAYGYRVFHWPGHYKRLLESARRLSLKCPWSSRTLEERIVKVLKANREPDGSVRITVARGPGPLGLDPSVCPQPTLAMMLHPKRDVHRYWTEGITIGITKVRRNPPEALDPQIKSNNSLNTIFARMEAQKMGVFEGVLLNLQGHLTEGTTSNVFFVKRGELYTPGLSCGLLAGITRETVLKLAKRNGIRTHEGRFTPAHLLRADEAFLSSTTLEIAGIIGVQLAGRKGRHRIGNGRPGSFTYRIHQLFRDAVWGVKN
jgi:branched-chain amino acid aminotransferase